MKPNLSIFTLAGLLALASSAMAHDPKAHQAAPATAVVSDAAQPAVAVVEQFSKALQTANFDQIRKLLADDVLILESGGAERSREEYLGHHAIADAAFLQGAHVQVTQRTARVEGPLAWVGTESELHTKKDGKPMTLLSTETMVLKKTGKDWRIVHIHWSSRPKK
jgi:ketosteroid isomerase-like protein